MDEAGPGGALSCLGLGLNEARAQSDPYKP